MEGFEGLTEEQLDQLLQLGILDDEESMLEQQMKQAEMMRNPAKPEMRGNGRVMVAANPLEFLGQGLGQYGAKKEIERIEGRRGEIGQERVKGRKALLDALRRMSGTPPYVGTRIDDPPIDTSGYA